MILKILAKIKNFLFFNRFLAFSVYKTEVFVRVAAKQMERNSKLLDVGAGLCPYKKYFKNVDYVSQDFCLNGDDMNWDFFHIDIKSDVHDMPIKDNSFDYILCTSVLEHLQYPQKAFREFARVLRKNGKLFLSVPLTAGEHHEPFDYYRFTKYGLQLLAKESGFRVIHLKKQGGFFIFLSQTISGLTHSYIKNNTLEKLCYLILYPVNFIISFVCYFLDKSDKTKIILHYEGIFEKE